MLVDWTLPFPKQNDFLLIERLISCLSMKNWNCDFFLMCHSCVYFINKINQLSQNMVQAFEERDGTLAKVVLWRPIQSAELCFNHWEFLVVSIKDRHLFLEMNFEPMFVYIQLLRGHHHARILILRRLMSPGHHSMKLNNRFKSWFKIQDFGIPHVSGSYRSCSIRVAQSHVKKLGRPCTKKYTDYKLLLSKSKKRSYLASLS